MKVTTQDLTSWTERLESLQKCNLYPAQCKHDTDEEGKVRTFDYTTIDMVLDQIISEMKQCV